MSDTTMITPEEREILRELTSRAQASPKDMRRVLNALEQAEAERKKDLAYCKFEFDRAEQAEARAERAESAQIHLCQWLSDIAVELGCDCDKEAMLIAAHDTKERDEKADAEVARLRERLEAALDKIAEIQDEWESEGVCHACGICAGIPYEWQPTDDHCCRVMLDLWSRGEPLPWEESARRAVEGAPIGA